MKAITADRAADDARAEHEQVSPWRVAATLITAALGLGVGVIAGFIVGVLAGVIPFSC